MIEKSMLRFTIPFHISAKNMNKNNIFLALKSSGWKQEHIVQGENDLYDYITELVNDSVVNDVASSWKLPKELYIKNRYVTRVEGHEIDWNLEQIGLVIFSTGVGILWYEIGIKKLDDFAHVMDIAYALKELARGPRENNFIKFKIPVTGEDDAKIVELESDESYQITEKINTPQGLVVKGLRKIELFNDVLHGFISGIEIDSYFANRVHNNDICPDRAIPFSWIYEISGTDNSDELDKAFHLGRAYKSSYDMSSRIDESDFYIPFDDSVWYASLEGCANYTSPNREKSFYTGGYETRLNTYFYIYILCLWLNW